MRFRASLLAALAGCAVLAVAGCAGQASAGQFTSATPGELTVATAAVPVPGFWQGSATAPTGGFEYGLAQALAERFGLARLRLVEVPFDRLTGGDLGGADLALAQITPTRQRQRLLDFSTPYLAATPSALVESQTELRDLEAARRQRWAVPRGTTLAEVLDKRIRPNQPVAETPDEVSAVAMLRAGRVDAVLLDLPVALVTAQQSGGTLRVALQLADDDALAVAMPPGSGNLEAVDSAIRSFMDDGTTERLARLWLGVDLRGATADVPVLRLRD